MITCLEEDNLDNIINNGIYLLEFYSEDCASCSFVGPIIESLSEYIDIIKIDVNKFKYLADEIYKITVLPEVFIEENGVVKYNFKGYHKREELIDAINTLKNK